ncbi:MAG: bifunctional translation initiation inhibitor [Actinomycetota bacterium]|nr:MAG: bifunctional translation initiation inhibitor [Actinomycetota bacterium]
MNDDEVFRRLEQLGLQLPAPPAAVAAYVPVRLAGGLAFVAGQVPIVEGQVLHPGRLGHDVSVDQGMEAARQAALQALSALRAELGAFDRLERIVQVTVFVCSTPEFTDQPRVANGASELFAAVLGSAGEHARAAVGVSSLPLGASVEVAVTAAVA